MNYRELSESIKKGEKHSVYLLHGGEEYVKDRLYEQLYAHLAPQMMPEFNVNILHNPTDEQIIAACMTPPMMAESKLVAVRDCPLLGGDEDTKVSSRDMKEGTERVVVDFISAMTDRYAINLFRANFIPQVWQGIGLPKGLGDDMD